MGRVRRVFHSRNAALRATAASTAPASAAPPPPAVAPSSPVPALPLDADDDAHDLDIQRMAYDDADAAAAAFPPPPPPALSASAAAGHDNDEGAVATTAGPDAARRQERAQLLLEAAPVLLNLSWAQAADLLRLLSRLRPHLHLPATRESLLSQIATDLGVPVAHRQLYEYCSACRQPWLHAPAPAPAPAASDALPRGLRLAQQLDPTGLPEPDAAGAVPPEYAEREVTGLCQRCRAPQSCRRTALLFGLANRLMAVLQSAAFARRRAAIARYVQAREAIPVAERGYADCYDGSIYAENLLNLGGDVVQVTLSMDEMPCASLNTEMSYCLVTASICELPPHLRARPAFQLPLAVFLDRRSPSYQNLLVHLGLELHHLRTHGLFYRHPLLGTICKARVAVHSLALDLVARAQWWASRSGGFGACGVCWMEGESARGTPGNAHNNSIYYPLRTSSSLRPRTDEEAAREAAAFVTQLGSGSSIVADVNFGDFAVSSAALRSAVDTDADANAAAAATAATSASASSSTRPSAAHFRWTVWAHFGVCAPRHTACDDLHYFSGLGRALVREICANKAIRHHSISDATESEMLDLLNRRLRALRPPHAFSDRFPSAFGVSTVRSEDYKHFVLFWGVACLGNLIVAPALAQVADLAGILRQLFVKVVPLQHAELAALQQRIILWSLVAANTALVPWSPRFFTLSNHGLLHLVDGRLKHGEAVSTTGIESLNSLVAAVAGGPRAGVAAVADRLQLAALAAVHGHHGALFADADPLGTVFAMPPPPPPQSQPLCALQQLEAIYNADVVSFLQQHPLLAPSAAAVAIADVFHRDINHTFTSLLYVRNGHEGRADSTAVLWRLPHQPLWNAVDWLPDPTEEHAGQVMAFLLLNGTITYALVARTRLSLPMDEAQRELYRMTTRHFCFRQIDPRCLSLVPVHALHPLALLWPSDEIDRLWTSYFDKEPYNGVCGYLCGVARWFDRPNREQQLEAAAGGGGEGEAAAAPG